MPVISVSSRTCAVAVLTMVLLASPRTAAAQDLPAAGASTADSLGFRRGQWGAIVAVNQEVAALGVLRFRSPRSAWVLNANASGVTGEVEQETPSVGQQEMDAVALGARFGLRGYRPIQARVAAYSGAGLTGSASVADFTPTDGDELSARMYGAGLYGELGIEYRAARYIALGVRSLADVTSRWGSETRRTATGTTLHSDRREITASIGRLEVLATLYF